MIARVSMELSINFILMLQPLHCEICVSNRKLLFTQSYVGVAQIILYHHWYDTNLPSLSRVCVCVSSYIFTHMMLACLSVSASVPVSASLLSLCLCELDICYTWWCVWKQLAEMIGRVLRVCNLLLAIYLKIMPGIAEIYSKWSWGLCFADKGSWKNWRSGIHYWFTLCNSFQLSRTTVPFAGMRNSKKLLLCLWNQ